MHTATITFDFPEKKKSIIFNSVKPDLTSTDRANTTVLNGNELSANIQAKDVVALRAALNTLLQMVSASEKTVDSVEPDKQAENRTSEQDNTLAKGC